MNNSAIIIRDNLTEVYEDVYSSGVLEALAYMAPFNEEVKKLMNIRLRRRKERSQNESRITFLNPETNIPGTNIKVSDAREGNFEGAEIPSDLQRQWIQGTGPGAKPNASLESSIRNVAYALLSGADGWMFDGEDALGQVSTMSLDNQRNLKLALHKSPVFLSVAEEVATQMNNWSKTFFGQDKIQDWRTQLNFTTKIFRARGLHLDDRHIRLSDDASFSASIADLVLYVVNNADALISAGSSIVLYLPKIQTAEEAALWNRMISAVESHLELEEGTVKVYVLVEQLEATYQLMEIRAALGKHFVGYNTGRWDYINSVSDAMAWDQSFINPNIESIGMTYGYMRNYEDRVRRAVNTPDMNGNFALWQGGMEPNIPVGSTEGVNSSMEKALAGAERELQEGANQMGRAFERLSYTQEDADGLIYLEPAPRTIRGARNLLSVGLQYGNAFGQGMQAAALKPADFFGDENVLYLMEDMATGEIRLSILWEWLHKHAEITSADAESGVEEGAIFTQQLFDRLLEEEYDKLLKASSKDVHDASKVTTLPIAKSIVKKYVGEEKKIPWFIDLLNINLNNLDLKIADKRIDLYIKLLNEKGERVTENLDFTL